MLEESQIQKALAWILFICGVSVAYLAFGESLLHLLCDVLKINVHPATSTGRMNGIVAIITVIVGGHGGAKWLNYKREKDCILPHMQRREDNDK